jgi:hypothetical protein
VGKSEETIVLDEPVRQTSEEAALANFVEPVATSPEQQAMDAVAEAATTEEAPSRLQEQVRNETLASIDFASIEPQLPQDWQRLALPAWLEKSGERIYVHELTKARLCRYITTWEDKTWQEMWSLYVSSRKSPDAVCIRLDLALGIHERHKSTGFSAKGTLLPWRT